MSSGRMKEAEMGGRGKTYKKVDIKTFYLAHLYRSHFKHNKSPFPDVLYIGIVIMSFCFDLFNVERTSHKAIFEFGLVKNWYEVFLQ